MEKTVKPLAPKPTADKPNAWFIATFVLAIALIGALAYIFLGGGMSKETVSVDKAGKDVLAFINEIYADRVGPATLKGAVETNGLYQITVSVAVNGAATDQVVYATKDGKLFIPEAVNMADTLDQYKAYKAQQQAQPQNTETTDQTNADINVNVNANTNVNAETEPQQ